MVNMGSSDIHRKNGKSEKNKGLQCISLGSGKFVFYPYAKKKSNTGTAYNKIIRGLVETLKACKPESIERSIEIIMEKGVKAIQALKKMPLKITIPKRGDLTELLVSIFTSLSVCGKLQGGTEGIVAAINITADGKKNLDRGEPWTGDIKISDNLVLKLTKSKLVLYVE